MINTVATTPRSNFEVTSTQSPPISYSKIGIIAKFNQSPTGKQLLVGRPLFLQLLCIVDQLCRDAPIFAHSLVGSLALPQWLPAYGSNVLFTHTTSYRRNVKDARIHPPMCFPWPVFQRELSVRYVQASVAPCTREQRRRPAGRDQILSGAAKQLLDLGSARFHGGESQPERSRHSQRFPNGLEDTDQRWKAARIDPRSWKRFQLEVGPKLWK